MGIATSSTPAAVATPFPPRSLCQMGKRVCLQRAGGGGQLQSQGHGAVLGVPASKKTVSASTRGFYGWWIAGATFVSLFVMVGLAFYGLPQFYPELLKEFHWSRTALTAPFAVSVVLIGPFAGYLIDRFGTKRAMLLGVICAAVAFVGG